MSDDSVVVHGPAAGDDGVAQIWINRPGRRNAVDTSTIEELASAITRVAGDDRVSAVVLRGVGGRFCAGADVADLSALLTATDGELEALFERQLQALAAWRDAPVVTVAVLEGIALGFGVALAAVCDRVISRPDTRIALPEVRLGMAPAMVVDALRTRMSSSAVMNLATSGVEIDAVQGRDIGLVDLLLPSVTDGSEDAEDVDGWIRADLGAAAGGRVAAVRQAVAMIRARRHGDPGDAASQSVRALRSPEVAAALDASRKG